MLRSGLVLTGFLLCTTTLNAAGWHRSAQIETTQNPNHSFIIKNYYKDTNYDEHHMSTENFDPLDPIPDTPYPGMTQYPHKIGTATFFTEQPAVYVCGRIFIIINGQEYLVREVPYNQ